MATVAVCKFKRFVLIEINLLLSRLLYALRGLSGPSKGGIEAAGGDIFGYVYSLFVLREGRRPHAGSVWCARDCAPCWRRCASVGETRAGRVFSPVEICWLILRS